MEPTVAGRPTLAILVGVQGSGKSTFYRHVLAPNHVLVSKDLLRNNRRRARRQSQLVEAYLAARTSVALDNTNATREIRRSLIELGRKWGALTVAYWLDATLSDCLRRNSHRDGNALVPDGIIVMTSRLLQPPDREEGFDLVHAVKINSDGTYDIQSM